MPSGSSTAWLELEPSVFTVDGKISEARAHKLIKAWIRQLAAAALGHVVTGYLVTLDAVIILSPMDRAQAHTMLADLLVCWKDGLDRPLPTACKTALALLSEGKPWDVYDGTFTFSGEGEDACLARLWDDYASLASEPEWESCSRALYGPLLEWYRQYVTVAPHDLSAQESEAA